MIILKIIFLKFFIVNGYLFVKGIDVEFLLVEFSFNFNIWVFYLLLEV